MMTLDELFKGKVFITDLGEPQNVCNSEEDVPVDRYAVWSPMQNSDGHQIVEVNGDLEMLKNKYNISDDSVCALS